MYVTGLQRNSHDDKTLAARSFRRLANGYTRDHIEDEDFLLPHRRDAPHNDPYGWSRDGFARLHDRPYPWVLTELGIPKEERRRHYRDANLDDTLAELRAYRRK